ncbi:MAG: AMP-binding protein [Steroidobacteraceae bacterium]|nr:AMP-binding protein [Steroidobacteraceae bacterium]
MNAVLQRQDLHPFVGLDLPALLARQASARAAHAFLVWQPPDGPAQRYSYARFHELVARFAAGLAARGIEAGQRVIVHLENCPEFLIAWHACARIGALAVTTNTRASAEEFAYFVSHSRARAIITQPGLLAVVQPARRADMLLICLDRDPDGTAAGDAPIDRGLPFGECDGDPSTLPQRVPDPTAANSVQYTSGTTSRPKGVVWTHANALWSGAVGATHLGLRSDDVGLAFMPLFHTNALAYSMLATLWSGSTLVLMHRFSASRFWPVAAGEGCTWASMIPFANKALLALPDQPHAFRVWGNAFVDPLVEERFGLRIVSWWGMTETISHCIVGTPLQQGTAGAMGKPAPEYEVAIVDESGAPVAAGGIGRLRVRGRRGLSLFREYLDDPEATRAAFDAEGWLLTGDLVRLLADGSIQFVDREKDVLKVGGENVAASEVERVILGVPGVGEVAVIGRAHEMLDEVPVALVIAAEGAADDLPARIQAACRERLAGFKVPREVYLLDEFPRAALNKIDKRALRVWLREQRPPP